MTEWMLMLLPCHGPEGYRGAVVSQSIIQSSRSLVATRFRDGRGNVSGSWLREFRSTSNPVVAMYCQISIHRTMTLAITSSSSEFRAYRHNN